MPHIGWNNLKITNKNSILKQNSNKELDFYFMHSYAATNFSDSFVSSTCDYGETFISSIETENITAVQFHPEKSHEIGINFLKQWLDKNVKS